MNEITDKKENIQEEEPALPKTTNLAGVFNQNLNEETIHTDASASKLAEFLIHQEEYVERQKQKKDWGGEKEEEYKRLMDKVKTYIKDEKSLEAIQEAYELASKAHAAQVRATGEPYIIHLWRWPTFWRSWKWIPRALWPLSSTMWWRIRNIRWKTLR